MLSDFQPNMTTEVRVRLENADGSSVVVKLSEPTIATDSDLLSGKTVLIVKGLIEDSDNSHVTGAKLP